MNEPQMAQLGELPPQMQEAIRQAQEFYRYQAETETALRKAFVAFAPVLCSCSRVYVWGDPQPPQAGCIIHGQLTHTDEGWL